MEDDLCHQSTNERLPLVLGAAKVLDAVAVPHHVPLLKARAWGGYLTRCKSAFKDKISTPISPKKSAKF